MGFQHPKSLYLLHNILWEFNTRIPYELIYNPWGLFTPLFIFGVQHPNPLRFQLPKSFIYSIHILGFQLLKPSGLVTRIFIWGIPPYLFYKYSLFLSHTLIHILGPTIISQIIIYMHIKINIYKTLVKITWLWSVYLPLITRMLMITR